jgi:cation diffusion facilitator family transporter
MTPAFSSEVPSLPAPHPTAKKLQAAWISLAVTLVLLVTKLAVGLATGSLALLSLAAESGIDLAAVLITLLAVRVSSIPPDEDHAYGHGKFESLSALAQGLLLLVATVWIAWSAIQRLTGTPETVEVNFWSFGVLVFSMALDFWRANLLKGTSRDHHSAALEASSLHFFTDSLTALIAIIALVLVRFANLPAADDWAAIIVVGFVAYLSVRLITRAVDGLTDRYTKTGDYDRLKSLLEHIHGVENVTRMRMRLAGPVLFVEVSIQLSRVLPFAAVQRIVAEVERSITSEFPHAEVTVHWRPVRTASEMPFDTLKMIAAEYGLMPHNIELSRMESGETALDYHVEFPPGTPLINAENRSQEIEGRIRQELPDVGKIFVHLEEERSDRAKPHVEEIERPALLSEVAACAKATNPSVQSARGLHLFRDERDQSLKLVLTLDLPNNLLLHDAHEIMTNVEKNIRKQFPELTRILIQAEPNKLSITKLGTSE